MKKSCKIKELTAKQFQQVLLQWFDQHGRSDLPWQINKTPYRVWVSEIMLQQTQVNTVIPFYLRFMQRFPSLEKLAEACEDEVLHLWTGLGYYSRARNLLRAAKMMHESKTFPHDLENYPGIGRSTAGAILAIAFGKKAPILDGNVKRVLTRFYGITEYVNEKKVERELWALAEKNTPEIRVADYTQAIMDLGATICVRGKPRCDECPFKKNCAAHALGIEKKLPMSKPKKIIPVRLATFFIFQNSESVLLEKRPAAGIWGGLWSLPERKEHLSQDEILKHCKNFTVENISLKKIFRHTFSHFHLDILPVHIHVKKPRLKIMESSQQIWYKLQDSPKLGLPAPVKSLLEELHDKIR